MERERQFCVVAVAWMAVVFCPPAAGQFGGGGGTASDPYRIYTAEQFKALRTDPGTPGRYVHYKLMADIDFEKVRQCYSTCKVLSWTDAEDLGGLIGRGFRCNINNCYAQGQVSGNTNIGGLIGTAKKTFATGCFWDVDSTRQAASAAGTGLSTAELQQAATFIGAGWDFVGEHTNGTADIWSIDEGKDYPCFTPEPAVPPVRIWVDDFEDGEPLPLWQVYEPTPQSARFRETNGRLELHVPTAPADRVSAARLSRGWALDGSQDFSLRVDYHFTAVDAGEASVSIGLTPDAATPIARRLELTAGCLDNEPVHLGNRADGLGFVTWWAARGCDNGTLYLSYNAAADELYLSFVGYGPANAWRTVTGVVQGYWAGGPLYIVLGGSAWGMALTGDESCLDNFAVDTGAVVP